MESRETLLQRLNETVVQLLTVYQELPDPNAIICSELWSAKDVLAHLTFWHESFARNVDDLMHGCKPTPLKGRFIDLNQRGVDSMQPEAFQVVLGRFQTAHQLIQENILSPTLTLIPYKKGSREYTPEEHLDIVNMHIHEHLRDVKRALKD